MPINIKRIYEASSENDGIRVLVDRLWPRGISKENAKLDYWLKNIGPAASLRKVFHQGQLSFLEFQKRYIAEFTNGAQLGELEKLRDIVDEHEIVTLLFAAKDEENNQAVILQAILKDEH